MSILYFQKQVQTKIKKTEREITTFSFDNPVKTNGDDYRKYLFSFTTHIKHNRWIIAKYSGKADLPYLETKIYYKGKVHLLLKHDNFNLIFFSMD